MVGGHGPAYAVATGKALLAYQPEGYVDRYAKALTKHAAATLTTLPALKEELRKVVRLGYATNGGEWRDGVGGVGMVVFNGLEQPIAAVGISGPLDRLTPKRMKEFAPDVQACARAISRAMGYRRSDSPIEHNR